MARARVEWLIDVFKKWLHRPILVGRRSVWDESRLSWCWEGGVGGVKQ